MYRSAFFVHFSLPREARSLSGSEKESLEIWRNPILPKFISIEEAVKMIPDGATVMFGGFMGCGNAHKFIDALSKSGVKDLTMICNDGGMPGGPMGEDFYGTAKLIHNKQVKRMIATHVGLNPEVGIQSFDGTLETILVPQGS